MLWRKSAAAGQVLVPAQHIYTVTELQCDREEQGVKFPEQAYGTPAAVTASICWS